MTDNHEGQQMELPLSETTDLPPQDPAETYNPSTRIPKRREFKVERPGNVNYAAPGGSYPGSRVVVFTRTMAEGLEADDEERFAQQMHEEPPQSAADAMNLYFKHRANLLTVSVQGGTDQHGNITLVVVFTNHLEGERLEHFQKYQEVVAQTMQKWEEEQEAKREAEEKKAKAKADEERALLDLGRKARDHNLLEKLRELDEENKKLKKQLKKEEK